MIPHERTVRDFEAGENPGRVSMSVLVLSRLNAKPGKSANVPALLAEEAVRTCYALLAG